MSLPPNPRAHLTAEATRATLIVQQIAVQAAREGLYDHGFHELLPPVLGPVTDPGARGSKPVDVDYYGNRYKLMTSVIFYKQASLLAFDKVFYLAPNVRLEPPAASSTQRHLAEFFQIDVEAAGWTGPDAMRLAESLLTRMGEAVVARAADQLRVLGRDPDALTALGKAAFDRMTHAEAVRTLHAMGHAQDPAAEIDWAGEALLAERADRPLFIVDYPKGSRGFYNRESRTEPGLLRNFDLIAAEGYGELASGGERESEYARVVTRMRETGENPAKYGWYLDLVKQGIPASSGFGLGVERLTRYLCGLEQVWQASAFPKVPGLAAP